MNDSKRKYSGSCLCGAVRYQVTKFEPHIGHCHCTMCRKFHGAAFSTFGEVKLGNLRWISGYERLKSYAASNRTVRRFCDICGSSMVFISPYNQELGTVEIALATLDDIGDDLADLKPDAHIYTSSEVPWLDLGDELPKYLEYRDGDVESPQANFRCFRPD